MEGVSTLDPQTLAAPDERIASESDARNVVQQLQEAEKTRMRKRAKIQGMIDGNPPYNPRTLSDKGRGHQTNFNTREAEGMADSAKTPYYNLVFGVPKFARVCRRRNAGRLSRAALPRLRSQAHRRWRRNGSLRFLLWLLRLSFLRPLVHSFCRSDLQIGSASRWAY